MLNELLVSAVRVKILQLFFAAGANEFYHVRDITRRVGTEINAVRRELLRLTRVGLLKKEPRGNRLYYRVREFSPYVNDIFNLVNKTTGLSQTLLEHLDRLGNVKLIFLSKAFLLGRDAKSGEVDLLLIGRPNQDLLSKLLSDQEKKLGREINYTLLTEDEFEFRKRRKDPFVINLLLQPRIVVFGDEDKYCPAKI